MQFSDQDDEGRGMGTGLVTNGVWEEKHYHDTEYDPTLRAHGVVGLSRSLSMREVSGSIPDVSNTILPVFFA